MHTVLFGSKIEGYMMCAMYQKALLFKLTDYAVKLVHFVNAILCTNALMFPRRAAVL